MDPLTDSCEPRCDVRLEQTESAPETTKFKDGGDDETCRGGGQVDQESRYLRRPPRHIAFVCFCARKPQLFPTTREVRGVPGGKALENHIALARCVPVGTPTLLPLLFKLPPRQALSPLLSIYVYESGLRNSWPTCTHAQFLVAPMTLRGGNWEVFCFELQLPVRCMYKPTMRLVPSHSRHSRVVTPSANSRLNTANTYVRRSCYR